MMKICPHCADEGRPGQRLFNHSPGYLTCKHGHVQREANAQPLLNVQQVTEKVKRDVTPPVAFAALGLALLDLVLHIL